MIEALVRWYRSQQLRWLLMRGNRRDAAKQFKKIRGSKTSLSWWERLFEDWLTLQQQSLDSQQQLTALRRQVRQLQQAQRNTLVPDAEISRFVTDAFALQDIDTGMIQCTGIDREVFEQLERQLADYLTSEFERYRTNGLEDKLEEAIEDLEGLKKGIDPSYSSVLSPQIYFLKYFLENVYSLYLAWFFVYKNQHLPTDFKLLDIAAGPGTTLFGLSLLLQRLTRSSGSTPPPVRISYASLEKQEMLQYRVRVT
ncbi:hypothetical protein [Baaleninema sp.]|uniref:hypothetical protein n=1 Tax=Baaleninema sp. TaxID=3101197 RepID=UPI003D0628E1